MPLTRAAKRAAGRGFSADVAENDGGAARTVVDEVVEVAADGARGQKTHRHFGMGVGGRGGGQQAELNLARHGNIALQLRLLAADGLIEARVLNGNGDLGGQRGQHALMVLVEEAGPRVLQVENADDAALVKEGDDQLGARFRVHGEVARILADVGYVDGAPLAHRGAHQAAGDGDAARGSVGVAEAPCVAGDQGLALLVEKHDGEHLVVDEAAQKLADAFQQRIEVEDRGQLDGNLVEHFKGLRLAGDAGIEAGVLNGLGDARGGQGEQVQMLGAEVAGLLAFQVHDADEAVLGDERHGQFGAHVGIDGDVDAPRWKRR